MQFRFTRVSGNEKTGPIPVTMTSSDTCPDACPFKRTNVCYAKHGPIRIWWAKTDESGIDLLELARNVRRLPNGQLWRHNQAGDLPGENDALDHDALKVLVTANKGRHGFTYTHKPLTGAGDVEAIREANAEGFIVNLSANDAAHADALADLDCGPVVCVLPENVQGNVRGLTTPKGRPIVVCPATYREDTTCATCGLCARADRRVIVGFPVHGNGRKKLAQALSA